MVWWRAVLIATPIVCATAMGGLRAAPFSFDAAPGRLPKNVRPVAYRIALVPDAAAMRLDGTESVLLEVRAPTATIVFNTLDIRLRDVRFDGAPVVRTVSSDTAQLTTVTLARAAAAGRHTLRFAYTGRIESGPLGLFAQPYVLPNGAHRLLLSTQLESTDARRVFPCWDEPAFRATFALTVTLPAAWTAVGNMPIVRRTTAQGRATIAFAPTPPMSSYLVELTAGDLAGITATAAGTAVGVWAVQGQQGQARQALANAQQILADYNAYFGYRYPLPKLDSIAVPGGFPGAMENWGAITYADRYLLAAPGSTFEDRQTMYAVQAHEMAHQWNGDLVTMGWWDDLWLNESFASWRAAKETDERNPRWHWWEGQDADKETAMAADARRTSHAVHVAIHDENEAETAFDNEITYAKGQAFLRMLEAYLTPPVFRDGVRRYIAARAFSNATAADLWAALSTASGQDVGRLASTWIDRPGFPLVVVQAHCDAGGARTIALGQRRFLLDGSDAVHTFWQVPLAVRSTVAGTPARVLFVRPGQRVRAGRCGDPLTVNAGLVGFYRVAYDAATLRSDTANFARLPDADRIALLDDQWALAALGRAPVESYLALALAMGPDLDARAWTQIAEALEEIERDERGTADDVAFTSFGRSLLEPVSRRLGLRSRPDEDPSRQQLRRRIVADLGAWGDPRVVAYAGEQVAAFLDDRSAIAPDDQEMLLTIVAQRADAATFDRLSALARSARTRAEMQHFYGPLMAVRDDALAVRAAELAMSPQIPPQAATLHADLLDELAQTHPALAWETYRTNFEALVKPFGTGAPMYVGRYAPQTFWRGVPLDDIASFVQRHIPPENQPDLARGVESTRAAMRTAALLDAAMSNYLRRHPPPLREAASPAAP